MKKQRKTYRPRYTQQQMQTAAVSRLNEQSAMLAPLDRSNIVMAMVEAHDALDSITHGRGTMAHAQLLAVATNMAMVLCEMGLGDAADLEVAKAAVESLAIMARRKQDTGVWGLTGEQIKSLHAVLALRDAQLESEDNRCGFEIAAAKRIDRRIAAGNVIRVVEFA